MILEHVLIDIDPSRAQDYQAAFKLARPQVQCQDGCKDCRLLPRLNSPGRFLLLITWETKEHHTEGFRKSAEYRTWSALLHPFYEDFPTINYYQLP